MVRKDEGGLGCVCEHCSCAVDLETEMEAILITAI